MPWSTRAQISSLIVRALPHNSDASVNAVKHARYSRFAPTRSTSQPLSGSISATASR